MDEASEVRALSLCTVLFRTHSLHCRLGLEKLNTTVGLLPTVCRETVISRALAALRSLQLGSRVCVRVSFRIIVHMHVLLENANSREH